MAHDLKIGALVAVTFLSAIGAAAAYRQSVEPAWQMVELLAVGEGGDGLATPPGPLPDFGQNQPIPPPPATAAPLVETKSKRVEPKAVDKNTTKTQPQPATPKDPFGSMAAPAPQPTPKAVAKSLAPPRPFVVEAPPVAIDATPAKSPPPALTKAPAFVPPAPLQLPPPALAPAVDQRVVPQVPAPSLVAAVEKAVGKPPENKATVAEAKLPAPPASTVVQPTAAIENLDSAEANRIVARSKPAPRDLEKTMKRPASETPQLVAAAGGPNPPAASAQNAAAVAAVPIAVARKKQESVEPNIGAQPKAPLSASIDNKVQPASFDVVGSEGRGEEFVPVRRARQEWSAVRTPLGNATGVVRQASWDSPNGPLRASAAPLDGSGVAVRSYEAQLYVVLDGDSYDSIAESMYRRRDLGPELARFNRARTASNAKLPVAERILLPDLNALLRDKPPGEMAAGLPRDRGIGSSDVAKPVGKAPLIPAAPGKAPIGFAGNEPGPAAIDSKDRIGSIPIAKPIAPGAPAVVSAAAKASERGIDPPPPTVRSPAGNPRELAPLANRDVRPAGATANGPTYTVQQAEETLYGIARRVLGDGRRFREIYELNTDRLANEYDLPIGVTLRLPSDAIRR